MAKLKVATKTVAEGGGEGENPKKSLSYDQIDAWSDFVEKNQNIKNFDSLWELFNVNNPKHNIDKDILLSDLQTLRGNTQKNADSGTWDRSYVTTGFSFPKMTFQDETTGKIVDFGRVNSMMKTRVPIPQRKTQYPQSLIKKTIPDGVKEIFYDSEKALVGYENPITGDIEYAEKYNINDPRFRKSSDQNQQNMAARTMLRVSK